MFKLFVVGETSGNPDDWFPWNPYRAIVLARDADEAQEVAGHSFRATEIPMDRAVMLMSESAPDGL